MKYWCKCFRNKRFKEMRFNATTTNVIARILIDGGGFNLSSQYSDWDYMTNIESIKPTVYNVTCGRCGKEAEVIK